MHIVTGRGQWIGIALLLAALAAVAALYWPGLGGIFHFDDRPNLDGLQRIADWRDALAFLLTNESGPTGRPVSLISFLLTAPSWPENPEDFLWTNICIHLLNGVLVAWAAFALFRARGVEAGRCALAAAIAGSLWVVLPLHAATVLLVIQRMASLAAMFVLAGLVGHLYARRLLPSRPRIAFLALSANLGIFGSLAVLSKENGAVLPLLILIAECTVLPAVVTTYSRTWRAWRWLLLALPSAAVLAYLFTRVPYSPGMESMRGFTLYERLLSQAVAMWHYLYQALLPSALKITPFHDTFPVYRSLANPVAATAVAGWALALGAAIWSRRRLPWLAFAVFWYLGAQVVESTVIPLELYFPHRAYLPLAGVAIAISAALIAVPAHFRRIAAFGVTGFWLLLAFILFNTTAIWGDPRLAADTWYREQPQSPRAIGLLLERYVADNNFPAAVRLLDRAIEETGQSTLHRTNKLRLYCLFGQQPQQPPDMDSLEEDLREAPFSHALARNLSELLDQDEAYGCPNLRTDDIYGMAAALLENPQYAASAPARHSLNTTMARISAARGDPRQAIEHYRAAIDTRHDPAAAIAAFNLYLELGQRDQAQAFIDDMRADAPANPVLRRWWLELADRLEDSLALSSAGPSTHNRPGSPNVLPATTSP